MCFSDQKIFLPCTLNSLVLNRKWVPGGSDSGGLFSLLGVLLGVKKGSKRVVFGLGVTFTVKILAQAGKGGPNEKCRFWAPFGPKSGRFFESKRGRLLGRLFDRLFDRFFGRFSDRFLDRFWARFLDRFFRSVLGPFWGGFLN